METESPVVVCYDCKAVCHLIENMSQNISVEIDKP